MKKKKKNTTTVSIEFGVLSVSGVDSRKKGSATKRRFSDLESVEHEGTSMNPQGFDDRATGVGEVSEDPELCIEGNE